MDTSLLIALIGVGGTLLGSSVGFAGSCILENIRTKNEKKNYISKALFEKQFIIYQELSDDFIKVIKSCNDICSIINFALEHHDYTEGKDAFFEGCTDLIKKHEKASSAFGKYCPFISSEICNSYSSLLDEIKCFCDVISKAISYMHNENIQYISDLDVEIINLINSNYQKVSNKWGETLNKIRKYMHSLEVK